MDMIVTPDCPECGGEGSVPFDRESTSPLELLSRRPCGACLKRWDDANPLPPPPQVVVRINGAPMPDAADRVNTKERGNG
jgi:hypothetical protein